VLSSFEAVTLSIKKPLLFEEEERGEKANKAGV